MRSSTASSRSPAGRVSGGEGGKTTFCREHEGQGKQTMGFKWLARLLSLVVPTWPVGCEDNHEVSALVAGPEEQRVERPAEPLAHLIAASSEERVGLVDEEQQALAAALGPVK